MAGRAFTRGRPKDHPVLWVGRPSVKLFLGVLGRERREPDEGADVDRTEVVERIHIRIVELHAEMQVRYEVACMSAAGACNRLTLHDDVAPADQKSRNPRERRLEAASVIDREEEPPAHRSGE